MNHQALCIGIGYSGVNTLPGSRNSANGLTKLLLARGFHVRELLDRAATKAGIAAALQAAYSTVPGQGDVLVLYFVGHGTQVKIGGVLTEALVPADGLADPAQLITASQWQQMLAKRPAHAHTWVCVDACYGGGILAEHTQEQVPQVATGLPWLAADVAPFGAVSHSPGVQHMTAQSGLSNLVQFSPCSAQQLSVERVFGGQWMALFTYYLLHAMEQHPHGLSYAQLFQAVKAQAMAAYPQGTPVMVGDAALEGKAFLS